MAGDNWDPTYADQRNPPNTTLPGGGDTGVGNYPGAPWYSNNAPNEPYAQNGPPGNSYANSHPGTPNPNAAVNDKGIDPDSIFKGDDGHYKALKRTYQIDPATGKTTYGYETLDIGDGTDLAAMAALTGVDVGALGAKIRNADVQYGQARGQQVKLGQYTVLGQNRNPDGSVTWRVADGQGNQYSEPESNLLNLPGLTQSDIDQAKAQWANSQATLNRMGQFSVVGRNADGSLTVRDGQNNLSTISRAQVAANQVPGITISDFDSADARAQQDQSTLARGGQWSFAGYDARTGAVTVKNQGTSEIKTVSAQQAAAMPGVNPLDIQQAQTQGVQSQWEQGNAFGSQAATTQTPTYQGLPGGSAAPAPMPTPPPNTAPISPIPPAPAPPSPYPGTDPRGHPYPAPNGATPPAAAPPVRAVPTLPQASPTASAGYASADTLGSMGAAGAAVGGGVMRGGAAGMLDAQGRTPTPISPQQQAQYRATPMPSATAGMQTPPGGVTGIDAGATQPGMSNQQLDLTNRTYQNLSSYVRQGNIGNRNLSGLGSSALGRPQIAGQA